MRLIARIDLPVPEYVDGKSDLDAFVSMFIVACARDIEHDGFDSMPEYEIIEEGIA